MMTILNYVKPLYLVSESEISFANFNHALFGTSKLGFK